MSSLSNVDKIKEIKTISKIKIRDKYSQIFGIAKNVLKSSTSHGIPNILRAEKLSVKILWSVCTLISTSLCITLIVQNFINYFDYEVTTTIRVKNEISSIFPTITVCNLGSSFNKQIEKRSTDYLENQIVENVNRMENVSKNINKKTPNAYINFIYICFFDAIPCSNSSFINYINPLYNECYSFNSGLNQDGRQVNILKSIKAGREKGLTMYLNVKFNLTNNQKFAGASIYIHEPRTSPFSVEPISINLGEETTIALYKTIAKQKSYPYSECEDGTDDPKSFDSELFQLLHLTPYRYSQKLCFELCFHKIMLEKCNCYLRIFSSFEYGSECNETEGFICCWQQFKNFGNSSLTNEQCRPKCPLECETMTFSKTVSIRKNVKIKDLTTLFIHFDGLSYTEIYETPIMGIVDLLSNVGGIAGLFLGLSFLSLVEILEILLLIIVQRIF